MIKVELYQPAPVRTIIVLELAVIWSDRRCYAKPREGGSSLNPSDRDILGTLGRPPENLNSGIGRSGLLKFRNREMIGELGGLASLVNPEWIREGLLL